MNYNFLRGLPFTPVNKDEEKTPKLESCRTIRLKNSEPRGRVADSYAQSIELVHVPLPNLVV